MAQIVEDKSNYFTSSSVQDQINAINERTSTNKPALLNHLHIETEPNKKEEQIPRNSTNIRPQVVTEPRKSVKDLLKLNEERLKLFKEQKEEEERRKSIKLKNRDEWRLKMQKLAEKVKELIDSAKNLDKEEVKETIEIYLPLARRINNQKLIDELNDLAMKYNV